MWRNYDLISGGLLAATGGAIVIYSIAEYRLGTFARMGPGMFPLGVGGVLAILGLAIAVQSLFKDSGDLPENASEVTVPRRALIVIMLAVICFSVTFYGFGLVPAIVATTIVSSFAQPGPKIKTTLLLALGLSAASVLIFQRLLSIPFPLFRWPI